MPPTSPHPLLPDSAYGRELLRPWKLLTFVVAMALLLYGAINFGIGDWDVGVTLLMGSLTYTLAPWSASLIADALRFRPKGWPLRLLLALAIAWLVVDASYLIYHRLVGNPVYRADNFKASMPIFFMAGMFWLYRGSLAEMIRDVRRAIGTAREP